MELELYSRTLSAPVSVDETTISESIGADYMATIHVADGFTSSVHSDVAEHLRGWSEKSNPDHHFLMF